MFTQSTQAQVAEQKDNALNEELILASYKGDLSEIKRLVTLGADPTYVKHSKYMGKVFSSTPFHALLSSATKNFKFYKPAIDYFLNDLKIDINQVDFNGDTVAHTLSSNEGVEIIAYLLPRGLDLLKANNCGEYPINHALSPTH